MVRNKGIELDIMYKSDVLRRVMRYQNRIYNSTLGLANLFQFEFGGIGFAVCHYVCKGCNMTLWTLDNYCC